MPTSDRFSRPDGDITCQQDHPVQSSSVRCLRHFEAALLEFGGFLLFAGGLFLLFTRVANWRITLSMIASVAVVAWLFHGRNPGRFASPAISLLSGGLLYGAFFMATDPVSGPLSRLGKWIYGAGIGATAILIRNLGVFTDGVAFGVLILGTFMPLFDNMILAAGAGRSLRRRRALRA